MIRRLISVKPPTPIHPHMHPRVRVRNAFKMVRMNKSSRAHLLSTQHSNGNWFNQQSTFNRSYNNQTQRTDLSSHGSVHMLRDKYKGALSTSTPITNRRKVNHEAIELKSRILNKNSITFNNQFSNSLSKSTNYSPLSSRHVISPIKKPVKKIPIKNNSFKFQNPAFNLSKLSNKYFDANTMKKNYGTFNNLINKSNITMQKPNFTFKFFKKYENMRQFIRRPGFHLPNYKGLLPNVRVNMPYTNIELPEINPKLKFSFKNPGIQLSGVGNKIYRWPHSSIANKKTKDGYEYFSKLKKNPNIQIRNGRRINMDNVINKPRPFDKYKSFRKIIKYSGFSVSRPPIMRRFVSKYHKFRSFVQRPKISTPKIPFVPRFTLQLPKTGIKLPTIPKTYRIHLGDAFTKVRVKISKMDLPTFSTVYKVLQSFLVNISHTIISSIIYREMSSYEKGRVNRYWQIIKEITNYSKYNEKLFHKVRIALEEFYKDTDKIFKHDYTESWSFEGSSLKHHDFRLFYNIMRTMTNGILYDYEHYLQAEIKEYVTKDPYEGHLNFLKEKWHLKGPLAQYRLVRQFIDGKYQHNEVKNLRQFMKDAMYVKPRPYGRYRMIETHFHEDETKRISLAMKKINHRISQLKTTKKPVYKEGNNSFIPFISNNENNGIPKLHYIPDPTFDMSTVPNVIPESNVGYVPDATPGPDYVTLSTCGSHNISSSGVNEWFRFCYEFPYPWVYGCRPQLYAELNSFQYWEPCNIKFRMFNFQTTSDLGPNASDHQGLSKNSHLIFYKDINHLFGPLPEPEQKAKAFTDYLCNERHMHCGYDKNGILSTSEPIKWPKQNGYIKITETCGEVDYVACNTDADYTLEHTFHPSKYKRLVAEWAHQQPPNENKANESPFYFRADDFNCKIVHPYSPIANGFYGKHCVNDNGFPYMMPSRMKMFTWSDKISKNFDFKDLEKVHNLEQRDFYLKNVTNNFSEEYCLYEQYKHLVGLKDAHEHDPMPALYFKLKPNIAAQGNQAKQNCSFDYEYSFTMKLSGPVQQASVSYWPEEYRADTHYAGNHIVPQKSYKIPVFYWCNDKAKETEYMVPTPDYYQSKRARYYYPHQLYAPQPSVCKPPPTTTAPTTGTTKKP